MSNRKPFEVGEWYHCFSRGVEKRNTFGNEYDANRFLMLLYLANGTNRVSLFNVRKLSLEKAFSEDRGQTIVDVGAYCLMPNHFHLLLKEKEAGGISAFMRKLGIAYTMYFNSKHDRVGNLFVKPFRSRRIGTDRYLQRVVQYIHLNPAELYEPRWKEGIVKNMQALERKLVEYQYGSLSVHARRPKIHPIVSNAIFELVETFSLSRMVEDARAYHREITADRFVR